MIKDGVTMMIGNRGMEDLILIFPGSLGKRVDLKLGEIVVIIIESV